jgi:hypothetical protein
MLVASDFVQSGAILHHDHPNRCISILNVAIWLSRASWDLRQLTVES